MRGILITLIICSSMLIAQDHTPHIIKNLQCTTCHSCEVPTKNNPCLRPCIREHLVTVEQSADAAPEVITIDKFKGQQDLYKPAVFTHKLHAEMSHLSGGCQTCHHYNPPGRVLSCTECHEASRIREDVSKPDLKGAYHRQCMDCHQEWSHATDCTSCHLEIDSEEAPVEKKSKVDHPKIEVPKKLVIETDYDDPIVTFQHEEHTTVFGLDCKSCHSRESCVHCHDSKITHTEYRSLKEPHENCSKCHDTEDSCEFCHDQKEREGFNHLKRTGFNLGSYHKKLNCVNCHTSKGKFSGLSSNCATCHDTWDSENFDHSVTGIELDEIHIENDCNDCHISDNFRNPTCDNCHDEISFPDSVPGKKIRQK